MSTPNFSAFFRQSDEGKNYGGFGAGLASARSLLSASTMGIVSSETSGSSSGTSHEKIWNKLAWLLAFVASGSWLLAGILYPEKAISDTVLVARALVAGFALIGLSWQVFERKAPELTAGALVMATLGAYSLGLVAEVDRPTSFVLEFGSLIFITAAALYRGPVSFWWLFFVPLGGLFMFLPILRWELFANSGSLADAFRASILPTLSMITASVAVTVFESRRVAVDVHAQIKKIEDKGQTLISEMKTMEADLKTLMERARPMGAGEVAPSLPRRPSHSSDAMMNAMVPAPALPPLTSLASVPSLSSSMVTEEFAPRSLKADSPRSEMPLPTVLSYIDILAISREVLEQARASCEGHLEIPSFTLTSPSDIHQAIAVRGPAKPAFELALATLLSRAQEGLARGSKGSVRVILKPSLGAVSIVIEDNGRGLSEEVLSRLESRGFRSATGSARLSLREIRDLVVNAGGTFDYRSRLGVGARAQIELARVDAWAKSPRARRMSTVVATPPELGSFV